MIGNNDIILLPSGKYIPAEAPIWDGLATAEEIELIPEREGKTDTQDIIQEIANLSDEEWDCVVDEFCSSDAARMVYIRGD